MGLLENEPFLLELVRLFHKSKGGGSGALRITMKRYDGRTKPTPRKPNPKKDGGKGKGGGGKGKKQQPGKDGKRPPPAPPSSSSSPASAGAGGGEGPSEFTCLFHAKLGSAKVSTVVHAKDVNKFQLAYCSVLKGNMDSFKKYRKKPGAAGAAISTSGAAAGGSAASPKEPPPPKKPKT